MTENLFSRLIKYRTTENKTSGENFLTESFAAVLENDQKFAEELITRIYDEKHPTFSKIDIKTQVQTDFGRPDLILILIDKSETEVGEIIFENKWGSPEGDKQLPRYRNLVEGKNNKILVFLTDLGVEDPEDMIPGAEKHIFWNDVAKWLKEVNKSRRKSPWISIEFLNWLKEVGMSENEFNYNDLVVLQSLDKLAKKLHFCLNKFKNMASKLDQWQVLGINWKDSGYSRTLARWHTYADLDSDTKLRVCAAFMFAGEVPTVTIWLESMSSDPDKDSRRELIERKHKENLAYLNDKLEFKLTKDTYWFISADTPLITFCTQDGFIPFENVIEWWMTKIKGLLDTKIISELCQ